MRYAREINLLLTEGWYGPLIIIFLNIPIVLYEMAANMTLDDLPQEIIDIITGVDSVGKLGRIVLHRVSRGMRSIIGGKHVLDRAHICAEASKHGYTDVLKWAKSIGCKMDNMSSYNAALNGHLDVLIYLKDIRLIFSHPDTFCAAIKADRLDIVKWLYENGCKWKDTGLRNYLSGPMFTTPRNTYECYAAAKFGRLDILQYLLGIAVDQHSIRNELYYHASLGGHLHVLDWLYEKYNQPPPEHVFTRVVDSGRIGVIEWCISHGCVIDTYTFHSGRKPHVLDWARSAGYI